VICDYSSLRPHLALAFLQVCRQVYGEAALIPLTKNSFVAEVWYNFSPLPAFLATLVPVQFRSIAKLFMAVSKCWFFDSPQHLGMLKLKGLRSLHLVLSEEFHTHGNPGTRSLRYRLDRSGLGTLSQLNLKSVDISFMFTSEESKTTTFFETNDIEKLVDFHREGIIGCPGAYLARRKAEQEERERVRDAHRAEVRSKRRLRPLTGIP
jgi:hypothetical protein